MMMTASFYNSVGLSLFSLLQLNQSFDGIRSDCDSSGRMSL
jgi:hypothetical protein